MAKKRAAKKAKKAKKSPASNKSGLYTLEVSIIDGLITEKFAEKNPVISRTIAIRGDQTLEDLHYAIFGAFNRFDPHMYEYQFGKRPMDPKAKRYVLSTPFEDDDPNIAGIVEETTVDSLGLLVGHSFGYWFDFGDDWWHQISVLAIDEIAPSGKFPKVLKRVGKSPPQYVDWDKED